MSTDAQSAAARLNSAGFIRSRGFIGGKWTDAYDGKTIEINNPATGEVITNVPCMGARETSDAITSAHDAFLCKRSKCLRKWYDLIMAHKEELGQLMTLEQGKPLKEAIGEVSYGASFVEFYAEEAKRVYGDIIPATLPDRRLFVLKQPVGVVGAITPWNFPLAMITRKVAPALACGCTVVIKPSELTTLTALAAAELSIQAGIPPGAVNVVMGNAREIGETLLASPQGEKNHVQRLNSCWKKLMAGAADTVKKVSLELGGNAPCIVFDDADLDVALKGTGIYEKFARAFSNAVESMKVGDGFGECVVQGPLINDAAVHKVESLLQDAISKLNEEVFGPVAPLLKFKTEEEAVHMANDTNAGLAAYIFTTNIQRSWRVAESLEYGLVGVNEGLISTEVQVAPFGGVKQSGLGREGSKYGMDEYLEK
ncbi:Succinate-semialdehyde dehydrogenase, mitochondrial [Orobanche gracilis]